MLIAEAAKPIADEDDALLQLVERCCCVSNMLQLAYDPNGGVIAEIRRLSPGVGLVAEVARSGEASASQQ